MLGTSIPTRFPAPPPGVLIGARRSSELDDTRPIRIRPLRAQVSTLSDAPPAPCGEATSGPARRKPVWVDAVDALARWFSGS